jgi:glycosyltransferase involved in cell wall biosynthesis
VVCTLTAALADDIAAEYSYPRERIVITAPGVDESWFDASALDSAQLSRLGLDANYLVAVGTVEPRKNLALLVEAHRRLGADAPMLAIAGPAGWGPQLGVTAADRVVLTGYLAPDVLRSVVAGARLLAFPSLYEGFGLPPLEALACGVPVVVTDLPATREVLGACATYFPSGDAEALQAALADVLATPGDGFARRTYARDWTWNRCAESVLHAYRLALQG